MRWADVSFCDRTVRQFAALCLPFFGGLALWQWHQHDNTTVALMLATVAVLTPLAGSLWPSLVRPIYVAWLLLAFPVGWLVSHLVLALLYFGVFTPVALFFRLIGRDALQRTFRPEQATYWQTRQAPEPRRYFRQY